MQRPKTCAARDSSRGDVREHVCGSHLEACMGRELAHPAVVVEMHNAALTDAAVVASHGSGVRVLRAAGPPHAAANAVCLVFSHKA